jgi:hypothetical protein
VSASTLSDTEGGRPLRPATARKYARALKKRGADPNEVSEIRDVLGEVFTLDPDPYWKLRRHTRRALRETLVGLVRIGDEDAIRELVDEVVAEHGEEGRDARERVEAAYLAIQAENREGGPM